MVIEGFIEALQYFGQSDFVLAMIVGTIVGIVIGVIPAIGGTVGLALVLPLVFAVPAEIALPFMVALWATTATGGAITSILLNVPGTPVNVATLLDGFPMTQKGEAGRAIGAAVVSSGAGGMVTAFVALAMIPLVLPMVMAIYSADMVFIILVGLSCIALLSRGSMVKGLMSGAFGLLLAFIGTDMILGSPRFNFGSLYLWDGIPLVSLSMGLFALPAAIDLAVKGGTIVKVGVAMKGMQDVWEGGKDVFRHWTLWLRCSVGGFIVGIIPGIGAVAATFMAYAYAKQISKHPESFGTGIVEGVIAPESANNAKDGGALLTTLALGIPGSSDLALVIGAFLMLGLIPGPEMLKEHLGLSLSLLMVVITANLIAAAICFLTARYLIKIASIPSHILYPIIVIIALIGAFAIKGSFYDIIAALVFSVLGLAMTRFGFPKAALILGYVLGRLFEKYFFIAYGIAGPLFFLRPISLSLIILLISLFSFGPIKKVLRRRRGV